MTRIIYLFLDFMFPCYCVSCGIPVSSSSNHLCSACLESLKPAERGCPVCSSVLEGNTCGFCSSRKFYPAKHISVFEYSGSAKKMIHALKFERLRGIYSLFTPFLTEKIAEIEDEIDFITYVPMSRRKEGGRGYNQSRLISKAVSRETGISYGSLLAENGGSTAQRGFSYAGRFINVIDRYRVINKSNVHNKTVLIIDDVFTTGATLNECARQLLMAGAVKVFSLSVVKSDLKKLENI